MKLYLSYDPASGKPLVVGTVSVSQHTIEIDGTTDLSNKQVVQGELVACPPKPSQFHTFDWTAKQWVDLRTLDDLKRAKTDEINAARVHANQSTFTHAGKVIAFDAVSQKDIELTNGEINNTGAMPVIWPGGWKAQDNSFVPITTVAEWRAFYSSIYATGGANFAHSQALKAQLAAATTAKQVEDVVWGVLPSPN